MLQEVLTHPPVEIQAAFVQVAERVPVNPELHTGVHVVPLADPATQSPGPELAIEGVSAQAVLEQLPVVIQAELSQVAESVPAYPELQVGVQVVPLAELATQSPTPALVIEGSVEQGEPPVATQVPV